MQVNWNSESMIGVYGNLKLIQLTLVSAVPSDALYGDLKLTRKIFLSKIKSWFRKLGICIVTTEGWSGICTYCGIWSSR